MRFLLLAIVSALAGSSCGGNTPTAPAPAPVVLTSLTVGGNGAFTDRAQTTQFTATALFSNGMSQDQTRAASWASSNAAVATVSSTGLVVSQGGGAAVISAGFQSGVQAVSGSRTVNVTIACEINNTATVTFENRSGNT